MWQSAHVETAMAIAEVHGGLHTSSVCPAVTGGRSCLKKKRGQSIPGIKYLTNPGYGRRLH